MASSVGYFLFVYYYFYVPMAYEGKNDWDFKIFNWKGVKTDFGLKFTTLWFLKMLHVDQDAR